MIAKGSAGPLRLRLQFLRAHESGDPYAFRFEPQNYILPTAHGDSPTARIEWNKELLADLQAIRLPGRDPALMQRVGDLLRSFVLQAGWAQYETAIAEALAEHRSVVVTIRSSAAELYALPWEFLSLKSGQFLGEVHDILLRFEWPECSTTTEQPQPRPEGGRILVAWSAAGGAVPATEHIQGIASASAAGFCSFEAATDVLARASLGQIVEALESAQKTGRHIAVLHLLAHGSTAGSTFGLVLNGDSGPVVVDAAMLRQQLAPFASMVRLVVLSACDSGNAGSLDNRLGSIAQALHRCGFAAVVASRHPLSVAGSIALTETLYDRLLSGPDSLETAFLAARKRLAHQEASLPASERALDWASLQLYARHDDGYDTRPVVFRPYRGLLAFEPRHRRFYFGRDAEVQEVVSDLEALTTQNKARLLFVVGASGTGKSSLVLAGVVPALQAARPGLLFLRMRPGSEPQIALQETLAQRPHGESPHPALLVIDQFEELFTHTEQAATRTAFAKTLWELATSPESNLWLLVTLRVDFLGRCGELVINGDGLRLDRIAYDESYRVFLSQLQPEQLRASIIEPAHKVGLTLEPGLADRMLSDVGGEPGALPLLEDTLDVLWLGREGHTLTQVAYNNLGGVIGALQRRADSLVDKLNKADAAVAQRLLVSLVAVADDTAQDTRLRVSLGELQQACGISDSDAFPRVLKQLVEARLLVQDGDAQTAQVEVAHEALIRQWPKLRGWLDEDRAGLIIQRRVKQAARQWEQQKYDESLLYHGGQLVHATDWRKTWETRLGDLERRFLDASESLQLRNTHKEELRLQQERRVAKQTRLAVVVLGVLFISSLVFGWLAYANGVQAKVDADRARDGQLISVAQNLKDDPTAAVTVLREVKNRDSTLWRQIASNTLRSPIPRVVLRGHEDYLGSLVWSPDGTTLVTAAADGTVGIWNSDGAAAQRVRTGQPKDSILSLAVSPDRTKVAFGTDDNQIHIWNIAGTAPPVTLVGHEGTVFALAWSPDSLRLASGATDYSVRVWNASGIGKPIVLTGHEAFVLSVAWSPDGKRIGSGSADTNVRLWYPDNPGQQRVLYGHSMAVSTVTWSPDGTKVASSAADRSVRIWNLTGPGADVVISDLQAPITQLAFSPDGKKLAYNAADLAIRIWNTDGTRESVSLKGHEAQIQSLVFSPDGKRIASGSIDNTARIWSIDGAEEPLVLTGHKDQITSVGFGADGSSVFSSSSDRTIRSGSSTGSTQLSEIPALWGPLSTIGVSSDGKRIVTGSTSGNILLFHTDDSAPPIVWKHRETIVALALSPDGKRVLSGSSDGLVGIWNVERSVAPLLLKGHESMVTTVGWSPDGRKIASGSSDGTARVWNADGSGVPVTFKEHKRVVTAVTFSPDGQRVASGSIDMTVQIWNADGSGTPVVLKGHQAEITAVAFDSSGRQIASASKDKSIRIWNADGTGTPIVLSGHQDTVSALAFGADGERIVSGSADKTVRIWKVGTRSLQDALWRSTTDCMPEARRRELLLESASDAPAKHNLCRKEVARRHGFPPALSQTSQSSH